jgi:hypothetical protein
MAMAELSWLSSCLVESVALLAGVRRREPYEVLAVREPKVQAAAAEEQAEQPSAPGAAPLTVLVVPPFHGTVPPGTSGNT